MPDTIAPANARFRQDELPIEFGNLRTLYDIDSSAADQVGGRRNPKARNRPPHRPICAVDVLRQRGSVAFPTYPTFGPSRERTHLPGTIASGKAAPAAKNLRGNSEIRQFGNQNSPPPLLTPIQSRCVCVCGGGGPGNSQKFECQISTTPSTDLRRRCASRKLRILEILPAHPVYRNFPPATIA